MTHQTLSLVKYWKLFRATLNELSLTFPTIGHPSLKRDFLFNQFIQIGKMLIGDNLETRTVAMQLSILDPDPMVLCLCVSFTGLTAHAPQSICLRPRLEINLLSQISNCIFERSRNSVIYIQFKPDLFFLHIYFDWLKRKHDLLCFNAQLNHHLLGLISCTRKTKAFLRTPSSPDGYYIPS